TGFINRLRVRPGSDGVHYLMAGHRFTENDIERKVLNGRIANTSVGLEFDYVRKEDGKRFPVVLRHVALTNRPWINRLTPFGVNASEEDYNIFSMQFSEPLEDEPGLNKRQTILSIPEIANKIGQLTDLHITQINGDCVG